MITSSLVSSPSSRAIAVAAPSAARAQSLDARPASRGRNWPVIILGLLLLNLLGTAALIGLALRDPGLMVEDDYDQRALQWDRYAASLRASDALGWTATATVEPVTAATGSATRITISLLDRDGAPVDADRVEVLAFPQARGGKKLSLPLSTTDIPGTFTDTVPVTDGGLWEVRLIARRDNKRFLATFNTPRGTPGN